MAQFITEHENVYRFDIEEKFMGSVVICADSFEEALEFLREQYEIHDHESKEFFNLRHYATNFFDENNNEYYY